MSSITDLQQRKDQLQRNIDVLKGTLHECYQGILCKEAKKHFQKYVENKQDVQNYVLPFGDNIFETKYFKEIGNKLFKVEDDFNTIITTDEDETVVWYRYPEHCYNEIPLVQQAAEFIHCVRTFFKEIEIPPEHYIVNEDNKNVKIYPNYQHIDDPKHEFLLRNLDKFYVLKQDKGEREGKVITVLFDDDTDNQV